MRTLWRYYALRFLQAFAASLLILALLVLVVDMLLNWADLASGQGSFGAAFRVLLLRTAANYLTYLIPVSAFLGAFLCVGQAARANEVMAVRAGGVSPIHAFLPLLLLALVISAFTLWLNETVGRTAAEWMAKESGLMTDRLELESGTVWYHSGHVIYSGREPEEARIHDARVFERNEKGQLVRTVNAAVAYRLSDAAWRFEDAIVRTFVPEDPSAPPEVLKAADVTLGLASVRSPRLDKRELAAQRLPALFGYIAATEARGSDAGPARAVLHSRLSAPLLALLFVLFSIPLALSVEHTRSMAVPTLQGVAVLTAFLVLREYAGGIAFRLGGPAALLPWAVVAAFAAWCVGRLVRMPR